MCEPITADLEGNERVTVRDLPGCQMASTIHIGPFEGLSEAYGTFVTWIEKNGYRIIGPNREIYLRSFEAWLRSVGVCDRDSIPGDKSVMQTEVAGILV